MTIVVVGRNSFIAGALAALPEAHGWSFLTHDEALAPRRLDSASAVVNLAFDPVLRREPYDAARDVDAALAARIAGRPDVRYVMVSSRMVYGPPQDPDGRLVEDAVPHPVTAYGRNKLEVERRLTDRLGDRLTIVRLSNVFGAEYDTARRTFFALALRTLAQEDVVRFDMSPSVRRDFLPVEALAARLAAVAPAPRPGVFNLGAGLAVPCGHIAEWLIAGHGSGRLIVEDMREHDTFWLDMTRANATWDLPPVTLDEVRDACLRAGRGAREILSREPAS